MRAWVWVLAVPCLCGCAASTISESEAIARRGFDYESRARPLSLIVPEIGQWFKVPLEVDGSISDLRLVVAFKDSDLKDVKWALAKAVRGEWKGDTLVPLPPKSPSRSEWLAAIQRSIDDARAIWKVESAKETTPEAWHKKLEYEFGFDAALSASKGASTGSKLLKAVWTKDHPLWPDLRAALDVVSGFDPLSLVPARPDQPVSVLVRYGVRPDWDSALDRFAAELRSLRPVAVGEATELWPCDWRIIPERVEGRDLSMIVRHQPMALGGPGTIEVQWFCRGRDPRTGYSTVHPIDPYPNSYIYGPTEGDWSDHVQHGEPPNWEWSEVDMEGSEVDSGKWRVLEDQSLAWDFDEFDPLRHTASSSLLAHAALGARNLAVLLCDEAFSAYKTHDLNQSQDWAEGPMMATDQFFTSGWQVTRPSDRCPRDAWQCDRRDLTDFLDEVRDKRFVPLAAASRFSSRNPWSVRSNLVREVLYRIDGSLAYELVEMPTIGLGLLYGLSPSERDALTHGGAVRVSDLSASARRWLSLELGDDIGALDLYLEQKKFPVVRIGMPKPRERDSTFVRPGMFLPAAVGMAKKDRLNYGFGTMVTLTLADAGRPVWSCDLYENSIPTGQATANYEDLPKAHRDMLDRVARDGAMATAHNARMGTREFDKLLPLAKQERSGK